MLYVLSTMFLYKSKPEKNFLKLLQISKYFSNMFIENNLHISGPAQFRPELFKGKVYM